MRSTANRHVFFFASCMLLLCSCASSTEIEPKKLTYESRDNLDKSQIELSYKNMTDKDVCLPYAVFPLDGQLIGDGSDRVSLVVDSVKYPLADLNAGYCASNCETKVPPGEKIFGSIPYSDFNLPASEILKDKKLEYEIYGFNCRGSI